MNTHTYATTVVKYTAMPRSEARSLRSYQQVREAHASVRDLRELLEAAGPLPLQDIAAGLDISVTETGRLVCRAVRAARLRQDEWERYSLSGPWRGW